MKQKHSFDCGHTCLLEMGVVPPAIKRGITGNEIISALGSAFKRHFGVVSGRAFENAGVYLFAHPCGKNHWVLFREGKVMDPLNGRWYKPQTILSRYDNEGWVLAYGIEVDLGGNIKAQAH